MQATILLLEAAILRGWANTAHLSDILDTLKDESKYHDETATATVLGEKLNAVYTERNSLAVALAKVTLLHGGKAGRGYDDTEDKNWDPEWRNVVYVEVPGVGQVSWHMGPRDLPRIESLPQYTGTWDGTAYGRDPSWPDNIDIPQPQTMSFTVESVAKHLRRRYVSLAPKLNAEAWTTEAEALIREAGLPVAKPQVEPVAYVWQGAIDALRRGQHVVDAIIWPKHTGPAVVPLYAAPQPQAAHCELPKCLDGYGECDKVGPHCAQPQAEPVAWMRRWFADNEKPYKERNEHTGKMRVAWKFNLLKITPHKCLPDDVPLYTAPAPRVSAQDVRREDVARLLELSDRHLTSGEHAIERGRVYWNAQAEVAIGAVLASLGVGRE